MRVPGTILLVTFIFIARAATSQDSTCLIKDSLPVLQFQKNSKKLTLKNKKTLDSVIMIAAKCPAHCIVVFYSSYGENEKYNNLMWDRAATASNYLSQKQVKNCLVGSSLWNNFNGTIYFKLELPTKDLPHPNLQKNKTNQ